MLPRPGVQADERFLELGTPHHTRPQSAPFVRRAIPRDGPAHRPKSPAAQTAAQSLGRVVSWKLQKLRNSQVDSSASAAAPRSVDSIWDLGSKADLWVENGKLKQKIRELEEREREEEQRKESLRKQQEAAAAEAKKVKDMQEKQEQERRRKELQELEAKKAAEQQEKQQQQKTAAEPSQADVAKVRAQSCNPDGTFDVYQCDMDYPDLFTQCREKKAECEAQ